MKSRIIVSKNNAFNFMAFLFFLAVNTWMILPRFHYTISVKYVFLFSLVFFISFLLKNQAAFMEEMHLIFLYLLLSAMYFLIAFPLNLKQAELIFIEQFMFFLPAFIYRYITRYFSKKLKIYLFIGISISLLVVYFSTVKAAIASPMLIRMLTSGTSEAATDITYRLANIGAYGSSYGMMFICLTAILVIFQKNVISGERLFNIIVALMAFYYLICAQFGTALLLLLIGCLLHIVIRNGFGIKQIIAAAILIPIILFLPQILKWMALAINSDILSARLNALAGLFVNKDTSDADLSLRLELLQNGFAQFWVSPVWGSTIEENGQVLVTLYSHSSYLDLACATGIIGLIIYLRATFLNAKGIIRAIVNKQSKNIYLVLQIVFVILGCLNPNFAIYEIGAVLFLYLPLGLDIFNMENIDLTGISGRGEGYE